MKYILLLLALLYIRTHADEDSELRCRICEDSVRLVERVILYNATATSSFQSASTELCMYVPENMRAVVRYCLHFIMCL